MPVAVFDLDGTLVSSAEDLIATLNAILNSEGLAPVDVAPFRKWVGFGAKRLMDKGFQSHGITKTPDQLDALLPRFLDHYEANMTVHTRLFDGALEAMESLKADGWSLSVCTNKSTRLTLPLLDQLGISSLFSSVVAGDTFSKAKPHAEPLLGAIDRAGGTAAGSVMIGDTATDIDAAKAAGVPVVVVDFGYSPEPVAGLGPDRVISHFRELRSAIDTLAITS